MAMDITLIVRTLTQVVEAMEQLAIPYHIGGSVASSLYGEFRPTQDVDIVADLRLAHARSFVKLLDQDYYIDEDAVRDAIRRRSSFSLISNETFMKVDVFLPKSRAFDQDAARGVKRQPLVKGGREFVLASPENMVVNKLEWYEMGGRVSCIASPKSSSVGPPSSSSPRLLLELPRCHKRADHLWPNHSSTAILTTKGRES